MVTDAAPSDDAGSTGGSSPGDPIGPTGPLLDGGPGATLGTDQTAGESAGITYFTPLLAGQIEDIASDAAGNGWFTNGGYVSRITPAGVVTQFRLPGEDGGSGWGSYVTRGSDGNIWVSNGTTFDRVTPSGDITEVPVDATGLFVELTSGADGNLWFVDRERGMLGRLTPSGAVTKYDVHGSPVIPGWQSTNPYGGDVRDTLAVDTNGDAWFIGGSAGNLQLGIRRASDGATRTFWPTIRPEGYAGIALDSQGYPWFTDVRYDLEPLTVGRLDGTTAQRFQVACPSTLESSASSNLAVVATDNGKMLWFTEPHYATLLRVEAATGRSTCFHAFGGVATLGVRGYPDRIAPAPDGSVWFTESTYVSGIPGGFPHGGGGTSTTVIGHLVP